MTSNRGIVPWLVAALFAFSYMTTGLPWDWAFVVGGIGCVACLGNALLDWLVR